MVTARINKYANVLLVIALMATSAVFGSSCQQSQAVTEESITFANLHLTASTLVYIAQENGFFAANHLTVTIKEFDTGLATSDALVKGDADLATMAEFVMVGNIMQKKNIDILGVMDKTNTTQLIGLKDRGISKATDLKGKRIGLGKGTSSEFYLGRFLELNGMNIKDVTIVDLTPAKLQTSLAAGDIDAAVAWAPYSTQILDQFTNDTMLWNVQSSQPVYGLIAGNPDWVASHAEAVTRFWKSLAQAEDFLVAHPDQAKSIIENKLNYDAAYVDSIWPQYTFSPLLDQSLITAMEDEGRWLIANNLTTEQTVPDFLKYINEGALKTVKPDAVRIIR